MNQPDVPTARGLQEALDEIARLREAHPGAAGRKAGVGKREALLWVLSLGSLIGAIAAGTEIHFLPQGAKYAPYQGLSVALGLVAAASLVMACRERPARG